ncbi:hypothetical protein BT96DRAFT_912409 [Gymnopus androsaceus JB14]|uniref:Uncharacterized protein n=1 Tax=Gymnopus androsaceus JB14 TaxID=1447944 RepID=A0A6A4IKB2_9AGAR|nr:hypothetical protein BT96DRAFT_912409 [Gymnopus androsaceus JB14]
MIITILQTRAPPDESSTTTSTQGIDTNTNTDTSGHIGSIGHRMIGLALVLGAVFLIFVGWLVFGKWPQRKLRQWRYRWACSRGPPNELVVVGDLKEIDVETGSRVGDRDRRSSQSWVRIIMRRDIAVQRLDVGPAARPSLGIEEIEER